MTPLPPENIIDRHVLTSWQKHRASEQQPLAAYAVKALSQLPAAFTQSVSWGVLAGHSGRSGDLCLQYKVKDITQADFGRLEIELAEAEMPGLMACRSEFGSQQPFRGAKIAGSLHMTIQTAVLIESLTALGAEGQVVLLQHLQHTGEA